MLTIIVTAFDYESDAFPSANATNEQVIYTEYLCTYDILGFFAFIDKCMMDKMLKAYTYGINVVSSSQGFPPHFCLYAGFLSIGGIKTFNLSDRAI